MNIRRALTAIPQSYSCHQDGALAILADYVIRGKLLPLRTASFLGACCAYETLTPRMRNWLDDLLRKENLPPIAGPS